MDTENKESLLIEKIKEGNEHAFEIAFLKYYTPLSKYIWKYVRGKDLAKQIAQEVFAKIWEEREELDPEGHLRGLLYKTAQNEALNHIKHQKIVEDYISSQQTKKEDRLYSPPEIDEIDRELTHTAQAAVDELPPKARRIFLLNREEGLTYREIAGYLGISIKTVESQMSRVLRMLRESLSQYLSIFILVGFWVIMKVVIFIS